MGIGAAITRIGHETEEQAEGPGQMQNTLEPTGGVWEESSSSYGINNWVTNRKELVRVAEHTQMGLAVLYA